MKLRCITVGCNNPRCERTLKISTKELNAAHHSRLVSNFPIFYGWVILVAGTLGLILTSPGQTYSLSIFTEHFITDLGLSRSLVSTLFTIGTLSGSLALPVVGRQIDRYGSRRVVVVTSILLGLACIYMGLVQNWLMLGFGFIAVRLLGQGSLGLVCQVVINQWWVRRRGLVMGLAGLVSSLLGLGGFPILLNWLIPLFGWRFTFALVGLLLLGVMAPLGLLLFRPRPELYGLLPDGGWRSLRSPAPGAEPAEENWTLREATRTPAFWVLSLSLASMAMGMTGLFFHMVSIFSDKGLDADVAAFVFLPLGLTSAVVNFGSGYLVDRIPVKFLLASGLFCQALAVWLVQVLASVELALLFGLALGLAMGLIRTMETVSWAAFFGRLHLGSISGAGTSILIVGSALGPIPPGFARDVLGQYDPALILLTALPFLLGLAALFLNRPRKREGDSANKRISE